MESVFKRDCVNFKLLQNGNCPNSTSGYCINCSEYVSRREDKIKMQIDVNIYFMKIVCELADAIIDEAFDITYQKYRHYPNIQTIRIMRSRFNFERR